LNHGILRRLWPHFFVLWLFCLVVPVAAMAQSPTVDLDVLTQEIKARPAGEIDAPLREQISLVKKRGAELRRITERLELQQRRCGSMPTGPCRTAFDYLKARREEHAGRLRMDQLKLDALIAERQEILKRPHSPNSGK
jgi:hypothetical protein